MAEFELELKTAQERVESYIDQVLPSADVIPQRLHDAMRYSALSGGKRVRPFLVYATGKALNIPFEQLDACAAAVELIHAYSLVHDDLPAMDDDDLRRGKPTCHKAYDDATAVLVGDALQTAAFHVLAHDKQLGGSAENKLKMIEQLAVASGSRGMVGGQAIDLAAVGKKLSIAELEDMHIHKTGALIRVSVLLATYACDDTTEVKKAALDKYAKCIGLAFQIRDDILDIEGTTDTLGKTQGADIARDKPTYPAIIGLSASKERAQMLHEEAVAALSEFGDDADALRSLSAFIINRGS